jgi:hypothetical protein
MQAVQSSPDFLPASTSYHKQQHQQQLSGSPMDGSLLKLKSLPHYHVPQQQQHLLAANASVGSNNNSPVLSHIHLAAPGGSLSSRSPLAGQPPLAGSAGPPHEGMDGAGGCAAAAKQQQGTVGSAVAEALRQHLLAAAGRVGVLHLALHATDAGLMAGWQQQLAAVVEPGKACIPLYMPHAGDIP